MSIKQEELQASFVEGNRRLEEAIKSLDSFQRIEEQLKSLENLNIQTSLRLEEQAKRLEVLDKENQEYKHQIELKDNHITNIETLNNTMKSTKGWRALEKLRRIKLLVSRNKKTIVPKVINKVKNEGLKSTIHTIERKLHNELKEITYDEWFRSQELSSQEIEKMKMKIKNFEKSR